MRRLLRDSYGSFYGAQVLLSQCLFSSTRALFVGSWKIPDFQSETCLDEIFDAKQSPPFFDHLVFHVPWILIKSEWVENCMMPRIIWDIYHSRAISFLKLLLDPPPHLPLKPPERSTSPPSLPNFPSSPPQIGGMRQQTACYLFITGLSDIFQNNLSCRCCSVSHPNKNKKIQCSESMLCILYLYERLTRDWRIQT